MNNWFKKSLNKIKGNLITKLSIESIDKTHAFFHKEKDILFFYLCSFNMCMNFSRDSSTKLFSRFSLVGVILQILLQYQQMLQ